MADFLFYDLESKSEVDLRAVGTNVYANHASTKLLCAALALDDEPAHLWKPGEKLPAKYTKHMQKGGKIVAHGVQFERAMHKAKLTPVHGWPEVSIPQFRCSQTMAMALGLPAALEKLSEPLGIDEFKDAAGKRVMLQMTKPRKARKNEDPDQTYWYDDEERSEKLFGYCIKDVDVMRQGFNVMWPLSEDEQRLFELDQVINDRGFYVDHKLLMAMRRIIVDAGTDINRQMSKVTEGKVDTIDKVAKIKDWINEEFGLEIKSLNKATIPELINDPIIPQRAKDALELRLLGAQAATKKVDAFLSRRDKDGRIRGAFVFHAAGTGRWASRGAQVHNLKRLTEEDDEALDAGVQDLLTGDYKLVKTKYANLKDEKKRTTPLKMVGDHIRTVICAAPGNVLIGADFSGIEARVTAWLAGEARKLQVFRDYDAGIGPDPYVAAAMGIFGITDPKLITKPLRQIGKGSELAFGFEGGVNAYKKFMPAPPKAPDAPPPPPPKKTDSQKAYDARRADATGEAAAGTETQAKEALKGMDLSEFTDDRINDIKNKWRDDHPNIRAFWGALKDAGNTIAKQAYWRSENQDDREIDPIDVKSLTFEYSPENGGFMFIQLPSGRRIGYPGINRAKDYREKFFISASGEGGDDQPKGKMGSYFMDNSSGGWRRVFWYGGLGCENIVQGVARDILAAAMIRIEAAGFKIVAHVHDECVIEVPKKLAKKAMAEFVRLMCVLPDWALGYDEKYMLPIVAKGWAATRYVK